MFKKTATYNEKTYIFYFLLPAMVLIFTFFILPNVLNFYYSFTDWNSYNSQINFIGLANFKELISDKIIFKDIITTLKYSFMVAFMQNSIALVLALALEKTSRINGIYRTLIFIPVLFSALAAGYIFSAIYDPSGPINQFLSLITGREINYAFLGSMNYTLFFLAVVHSWKGLGINMLVFIAALNTIPEELIEAAKVEGANFLQIVRNIKLPLIGQAFTFNLTISLIWALTTLEIVLTMTRGGPGRSTEVLNYLILREFGYGKLGYTVSISLLLFILVCLLGFILIIFLRKREVEL